MVESVGIIEQRDVAPPPAHLLVQLDDHLCKFVRGAHDAVSEGVALGVGEDGAVGNGDYREPDPVAIHQFREGLGGFGADGSNNSDDLVSPLSVDHVLQDV